MSAILAILEASLTKSSDNISFDEENLDNSEIGVMIPNKKI